MKIHDPNSLFYIAILIVMFSSIVLSLSSTYYHYYDLNNDPYEANNLYGNVSCLTTYKQLQANGTKWFSQVGNLQMAGR